MPVNLANPNISTAANYDLALQRAQVHGEGSGTIFVGQDQISHRTTLGRIFKSNPVDHQESIANHISNAQAKFPQVDANLVAKIIQSETEQTGRLTPGSILRANEKILQTQQMDIGKTMQDLIAPTLNFEQLLSNLRFPGLQLRHVAETAPNREKFDAVQHLTGQIRPQVQQAHTEDLERIYETFRSNPALLAVKASTTEQVMMNSEKIGNDLSAEENKEALNLMNMASILDTLSSELVNELRTRGRDFPELEAPLVIQSDDPGYKAIEKYFTQALQP